MAVVVAVAGELDGAPFLSAALYALEFDAVVEAPAFFQAGGEVGLQAGDFGVGVGEGFAAQLCLEFGRLRAARQFATAGKAAAKGGVEGGEAFAVEVEVECEVFVVQFAVEGDAVVTDFDVERFDVVFVAVQGHFAVAGEWLFLPAAFEVVDVGGELDFAVFDAARAGELCADFAFECF